MISRAQFLKLFLDLIDKGFLVSESDMDILNVNTKCGLQIPRVDMQTMLGQKVLLQKMHLPSSIENLISHE